jgi:small nuclear ribonucleoprotein (snRNP)-like protein
MSKIQAELAKASEVEPKRGEKITDEAYIKRLIVGVGRLSDKAWGQLSEPAQDWFNEAADKVNANKAPPIYPDAEEEEVKPRSRRKAAEVEEEEKPAKAAKYEPTKGDKVTVVTKRGKEYVGKIIDPDDKGELVLEVDGEELGLDLERIDTIVPMPADESKSRRKAAEAEDDEGPADPEVSDTVEIKTKRGKVMMGNVIEIDDKVVVIKTAAGDEEEFDKDRIESIVVKVKNAGKGKGKKADDEPKTKSRGKASDGDDDSKEKRTTKEDNGGVSVTLRARELICDNPDASKDDIVKMMKKEALEFKETTVGMIHADCHKMFKLLRERKMMK